MLFVGVVIQFIIALANASTTCSLLPIDSYSDSSEPYQSLTYSAEKNPTEIADILSLKQSGEYKLMFDRMREFALHTSHPQALYNLGQFYRQGIGTAVNFDFAIESYYEAAMRGSDKAAVNLAVLMDEAILKGHASIPTLLVPLTKEYSLYWLLTAQRMTESATIAKSLDSLTQQRLQDPTYASEFTKNYPNYNNKQNPYQNLLDQMNSFQSNFNVIFKKNAQLDSLIANLNALRCLLQLNIHFYSFNKLSYLELRKTEVQERTLSTLSALQRLRSQVNDRNEYKKLKFVLEKWNQELTNFLETTNTL